MTEGWVIPSEVRYIKLGAGGEWAADAIANGTLPLGYREVSHEIGAARDWRAAQQRLIDLGWPVSTASQGANQVLDFYSLGRDALWVTVAQGHLWWAFAQEDVVPRGDAPPDKPSRYRRVVGQWRRDSLKGEPLTTRSLSSALTKTANYRMTICKVARQDYLLRRITGDIDPLHSEAVELKGKLISLALRMIRQLDWKEFEVLVDLIFASNGWQRSSLLGGNLPDVDLVLEQPSTSETAWVQVKSRANQGKFDDYLARFRADGSCDRFYFACHSPVGTITAPDEDRVHLWAGESLAEAAIRSGLFDWLTERTV